MHSSKISAAIHTAKLVQKLVLLFLERAHQVETAACLS